MRYNDRLREKQEMRHDLDQKNEAEEHDTGESEHFGIPPITYGELFEQVRTRRSRELEEERPGHRNNSNAISNTSRSLTAFMDVNELCKSDLVGPELYEMNLAEKTIQKIGTNATARRRRSEMNKRVRPWAIELIRVRQHPFHNESFGQRLRRLREEAGLSQSQLSKEGQRGGRLGPNIASWELERAYPSVASVEIVKRLEDVLQVPRGYLVGKLAKTPPFSMSFETGLPKSIQRRVAQHLPADFNVRSDDEKDQILAWVAENILLTPKEVLDDGDETQGGCHDLSFYSLSRKPSERLMMAPEGLLSEIDEIRKYKTTELLPMGLQRNEKWGPVSADKADYELRAFMGALVKMACRSPKHL